MPSHNIYLIDLPLLVVLISLVYSATRFDQWSAIFHEAFRWGIRLVGFLALITVTLYMVNSFNLTLFIVIVCVAAVFTIMYVASMYLTRAGT